VAFSKKQDQIRIKNIFLENDRSDDKISEHLGFVRCCYLDTCQFLKCVEMHCFMEYQFKNSGLKEIKKLVV